METTVCQSNISTLDLLISSIVSNNNITNNNNNNNNNNNKKKKKCKGCNYKTISKEYSLFLLGQCDEKWNPCLHTDIMSVYFALNNNVIVKTLLEHLKTHFKNSFYFKNSYKMSLNLL